MKRENHPASINQIEDEVSNLLIKAKRLTESEREQVIPALEKIISQLHDLTTGAPAKSPAQSKNNLDGAEASAEHARNFLLQQTEGPPEIHLGQGLYDSLRVQLSVIYYEWDLQTNQVWFSEELEKIIKLPAGIEQNHPWWLQQIYEEDRERIEPVLGRIQLDLQFDNPVSKPIDSYDLEYRILASNGAWVPVWDRGIVERDAQGRPRRAVGTIEDISRLKHAQQALSLSFKALTQSNIALRKKEEQVRSALANIPVAFFQTDQNLRYTWIFSPMLDETAEQFIGKRDDEILSGEGVTELINIKQDALKYRIRLRREMTIPFEGRNRLVFVSVQPIYDDQQNPTGLVGVFVDVTEQRNLENLASEKAFKLELNRRLLEQRELEYQEIGRFIQNGPIQDLSGMGFTLQLARQLFPGPDSLNVLEQLKEEIRNLVVELRDVSNELRPPGVTRFGLSRALQSYTEEFQLKNPNIKISLALSDSGAGLTDQTVHALFHIIEECFRNIINHAKASEVAVNLAIQPEKIHLEIKDNGIGFYEKPDWMDLTRKGCFGLVRMKESAEGIGGTLDIQSNKDSGTVVVAEVPLPLAA